MANESTVIALDVEGTLISNGVSRIPRPGLAGFLEECAALADRLVIFTSLPEAHFRTVAQTLTAEGEVPRWFADLDYVRWSGPYKRLSFVDEAGSTNVWLLDDIEECVHPDDRDRWIAAPPFEPPYTEDDRGLADALEALVSRIG